ncbi:MAG: RlmE family RNA methyltransferase [Promethearchaeota archaeon]
MTRWKKDEVYRRQARKAGYRSRAAFKLLEIDDRFEIFKDTTRIVDLCCAPGSWLQVIKERCDVSKTSIIGIDIVYVKPIPGVNIIQSCLEAPELANQVLGVLEKPAQVVLSDCAPKLSGNKSLDRERQLWLAKLSFQFATKLLEREGRFVTKVFQSDEFRDFVLMTRKSFRLVKTYKPQASFKRSPEIYLVAKGFSGVSEPVIIDNL